MTLNQTFLSASQLGRRIQIPASRILASIERGEIQPDGQLQDARTFIFSEGRAPEIAQRLETLRHQPTALAA